MRRSSFAYLLLLVGIFLLPQPAEACACCDATTERRVLGWSKGGYSVLVETEAIQACKRTMALEIWRPDTEGPHHCYDLLRAPNERIDCGALNFDQKMKPKASAQPQPYPTQPLLVDPEHLSATLEIGVGKEEENPTLLRAFLWQAGRWLQIYQVFSPRNS